MVKQFVKRPAYNSTYPKGGVSCSKDSFVVNGSLVFRIKFCGGRQFCASYSPPSPSPDAVMRHATLTFNNLPN